MKNRSTVFLFLVISIICSPLCLKAQLEVYPLHQLASGEVLSGMRLFANTDSIKLKLPYIEDFSGPQVPIQKIDTISDTVNNNINNITNVYRFINLKMHGLKNGDSILISVIKDGTGIPQKETKPRYVKIPKTFIKGDVDYYDTSIVISHSYSPVPDTTPTYTLLQIIPREGFLPPLHVNSPDSAPVYTHDSIIFHYSIIDSGIICTQHKGSTKTDLQFVTKNNQPDTIYYLNVKDTSFADCNQDTLSIKQLDTITFIRNDTLFRFVDTSIYIWLRLKSLKYYSDTTFYHYIDSTGTNSGYYPDRYSFLLYDDAQLTKPTPLDTFPGRPSYLNWTRAAYSSYSNTPDSLGFVANYGGTTVNDGMGINPISIGMVSFDGINYLGFPYSTSAYATGFADVLLSLPFDLSAHTLADSIYMSFFYQPGGLGERPDPEDFLLLEFKDVSNTWVPVWQQNGTDTSNVTDSMFAVAMVKFDTVSYLHKDFQYRFRSHGRLSGHFDVWNIDYIYIDTGRTVSQPYISDFTLASVPDSLLKGYRSVPYKHFVSFTQQNPGSLDTLINRTQSLSFRNMNVLYTNSDTVGITPKFLMNTYDNLGKIHLDTSSSHLFYTVSGTGTLVDSVDTSKMTAPYVLKQEYSFIGVNSVDQPDINNSPYHSKYDMSFNNSQTVETYFYDYYAYDDFTPEYTIKSNLSGIIVTNQFKILVADTLTHMDICFQRNDGPDLTGFIIYMGVWDGNVKVIDSLQQIPINYAVPANGFTRYQFNTPRALAAGTYYFGYQQFFNSPQNLFIGYDRNNDFTSRIFYNSTGAPVWSPFKTLTNIYGAMMLRPVFSKNEILLSTKDPVSTDKQFVIYPNPNGGNLHFMGQPEYMIVYDINGRKLLEEPISSGSVSLSGKLADGLYILYLSKGMYTETHKLILLNEQ